MVLAEVEYRVYYGESARTLHQHSQKHLGDYKSNMPGSRAKPRSSWMFDHLIKHHEGVSGPDPAKDCTFRLQGALTDCLGRQLDESVRLDLVEERGEVVVDRGEGRGGRTVDILNRRGREENTTSRSLSSFLLPRVKVSRFISKEGDQLIHKFTTLLVCYEMFSLVLSF